MYHHWLDTQNHDMNNRGATSHKTYTSHCSMDLCGNQYSHAQSFKHCTTTEPLTLPYLQGLAFYFLPPTLLLETEKVTCGDGGYGQVRDCQ